MKNLNQYTSQRGLAQICKTSPQTIARIANELKLGTNGKYANSPKVFTPAEGQKIAIACLEERTGEARNRTLTTKANILRTAQLIGALAPLASAMQHPDAREVAAIGEIAKKVAQATDGKLDIKSHDGKARFLNAFDPHFANLTAALAALQNKSNR